MKLISLNPDQIVVPADRQRQEFGDLVGLAASIFRLGLMQPLVVRPAFEDEAGKKQWGKLKSAERKYYLIAGERRFRAISTLIGAGKWDQPIPCRPYDDLSSDEVDLIELEENFRRKDLEWWEMIEGVARFARKAEALGKTQTDIAGTIGVSPANLSKMLRVALAVGANTKLRSANSWTACYTALTTREDKEINAAVEDILADAFTPPPATPQAPPPEAAIARIEAKIAKEAAAHTALVVREPPAPSALTGLRYAYKADFRVWASTYTGKRYNLVHCDFPYGLDMGNAKLQGSSARWTEGEDGRYEDDPKLYWNLLQAFIKHKDRFLADSAHIIWWLAPKNLNGTTAMLSTSGFWVCEYPLIWHKSDQSGIAPDVQRQPRRTYEMAILASRGDRKIAKVKAASISAAPTRIDHLSEKPLEVVTHFLEMLVDDTSEILDPTCGSGTALEAAIRLGARRATGLDILEQHVLRAHERCAAVGARAHAARQGAVNGSGDHGGESQPGV